MQLHNLFPFPEERKTRRRVGRGAGSGLGCMPPAYARHARLPAS